MKRAALLLVALACSNPLAPEGAHRVQPPASYAALWARAERCTGRTAPLERVRWYVVDADPSNGRFRCSGKPGGCFGRWVSPHSIYLSSVLYRLNDEGLVVHEMIHDLLRGDSAHRHPAFRSCGR